ncbi:single-stranded-DNA-specific exonuclease RecJ [Silvibacterium dinghuense]|uniref:Single-stranded-DNA-specific exonuclease RecJ n=1 Tax=Silvibacterium dinghuense TaxID=1560006 RepID=A0A4Q1SG25_9BACT|nr:single-stranded-DNA-specific exonuclease RecJ [Silvibacterium dinghuense]RXS96484.1 single-stranded-DNA-specific exonuclease RecJ [Silvibacterium dinghuense]GGG91157.1 single-stranded-DNA-specific exonuclease RecJ [Silvibacterium dinghuense]
MTETARSRHVWLFPELDTRQAAALAHEAQLPQLIAELLVTRGITDAEAAQAFLHPSFDQLLDPYTMLGMEQAVARIQQAAAARETVLIYGDYDVDGTTAVVLLKTAIEMLGGVVRFHVPHRIREGYGMQREILEIAAREGVRLVISVDTGIRAFAAAEAAETLGLDLIVTDHHLPETAMGLPRARAILNPNQPDCGYACKYICGAGVAFKLSQALLEAKDRERARTKILPSFLKLLAIATVADAVPLLGENRAIVALGLEELRKPVNPGLRALMQVAQLDPARKRLTPFDIGFRLGPRINAAGRMDVASDVVELFTTRDPVQAQTLAAKLEQLNLDRRETEAAILAEILERVALPEFAESRCVVMDGEGWHRGVIGILASRIVDQTGKPALVLAHEDGEAYGSGRSVAGFHLLEAIESCHELFTRFGGHAHAVGFSLPSERVPELRARLAAYAANAITGEMTGPPLACQAELPLDRVTPATFAWLRRLEPMGMGNEEPVFVARDVRLAAPPRLMKERHVALQLAQGGNGKGIRALGWNWAARVTAMGLTVGSRVDVAYRMRENEHPEFGGLELEIADLQPLAD